LLKFWLARDLATTRNSQDSAPRRPQLRAEIRSGWTDLKNRLEADRRPRAAIRCKIRDIPWVRTGRRNGNACSTPPSAPIRARQFGRRCAVPRRNSREVELVRSPMRADDSSARVMSMSLTTSEYSLGGALCCCRVQPVPQTRSFPRPSRFDRTTILRYREGLPREPRATRQPGLCEMDRVNAEEACRGRHLHGARLIPPGRPDRSRNECKHPIDEVFAKSIGSSPGPNRSASGSAARSNLCNSPPGTAKLWCGQSGIGAESFGFVGRVAHGNSTAHHLENTYLFSKK